MKYDVHVYFTMRVEFRGIEARSQRAAIKQANKLVEGVPLDLARAGISRLGKDFDDAEEITGYLVDEQGDEEYERTRSYTAGGKPIRRRRKGQTALD